MPRFAPRLAFGGWGQDAHRDQRRLRRVVDVLVDTNVELFRENPLLPGLYQAAATLGLRYEHHPNEDELAVGWADVLAVYEQRFGDCKALSAIRVAELRVRHGNAARVELVPRRGVDRWHALARHENGFLEDPSRALGWQG